MRPIFLTLFLSCMVMHAFAQKKVATVSFYLDREVDFSLMQMFNDDSEDKIKKLMEDPEFDLAPMIKSFHDYVVDEVLPSAPFKLIEEESVLGSEVYQSLSTYVDVEKTKLQQPSEGYLRLGNNFQDAFLTVVEDQGADGVMLIELKFFVRKSGLKTVIMAQVEMILRNKEGKNAWKYLEFGISEEGINTFAGFAISKQDEVMPLFTSAVDRLKEKMNVNFEKRAVKSTKKL